MDNKRPTDIVTIVNVLDEDFSITWGVRDNAGNLPTYSVKAGESAQFIRYVADAMAKHMVDRVLALKGDPGWQKMNNKAIRKGIKDTILFDEMDNVPKNVIVEEEKEPESVKLEDLNWNELRAYVKARGIKISSKAKKQDYIDIIRQYERGKEKS